MSRWLAQALAEATRPARVPLAPSARGGPAQEPKRPGNADEPRVPIVPIVPIAPACRPIGTIGTIGTAPRIEIEERIAMALEGGVPALYAEAFAQMQATCPAGMSTVRWEQAANDAGLFLDAHGAAAAALGWRVDDLFAPEGLVWALAGERVSCLSSSQAVLSDGRRMSKELRFFDQDVVL